MPFEHRQASALDVLDRVLDKGLIVDYYARFSLLGIDLATIMEGRVICTSLETDREYWEVHRALTRARVVPPRLKSAYDGPAPLFAERDLPIAKARDSILNPFTVYQTGERRLRGQLGALSVWHLVNIAKAYRLVKRGIDPTHLSQPELIEMIVSGVKRRVGQPAST
jgi:hypothetical protein